jgi:hypothetical protein
LLERIIGSNTNALELSIRWLIKTDAKIPNNGTIGM